MILNDCRSAQGQEIPSRREPNAACPIIEHRSPRSGARGIVIRRIPTPSGLRAMRRIATGLFIGVTILYVSAHLMERTHPWAAFVGALAEAAMVGALADWFAVTALFRHPLGIPIPHTAVIPRSKDRIGEGLGRFVEETFRRLESSPRRFRAPTSPVVWRTG